MIVTVAVVFTVGLVVLLVIADEIVQAEAVMSADEINARPWPPPTMGEQICRTQQAGRQFGSSILVTSPERSDGIAKLIIPFTPAGTVLTQPVAVRADIPRLGNHLDRLQDRILAYCVQKAATPIPTGSLPPERGGKVKPEAVDVHGLYPVPQGIHYHLQHAWMGQIK